MSENESVYGTTLSQESMKVIAESIGVGNLPDEAAKDLAEDVSYKLKEIIQVYLFFNYFTNLDLFFVYCKIQRATVSKYYRYFAVFYFLLYFSIITQINKNDDLCHR